MKHAEKVNSPREFAQLCANKMREILESGKEAIPICFVRSRGGDVKIVGFNFPKDDNGRGKDVAALAMRIFRDDPQTEYAVFLSDTWMAVLAPGEEPDYSQEVKNHPNRKEAIVAAIFARDRLIELGKWVYSRDENGRLVFASSAMEWVIPEYAEGRFIPQPQATTRRQ